jgi:two-component system, OmpR family, sensor kinase
MKLFWKLFITLGVAMTVAMVAAVTMGWQVGQLAVEQFFDFNFENREAVINRASQALNRGGREELTSWLRQNQIPVPGRRLLIIDDRGEDLLGREIPEDARRFLRFQSLGQGDRRWESFGAARNRMGPQLTDILTDPNNGESFRILFDTTAITLLNILRMPATQVGVVTLAIIMAAATALLLAKSFSSPIVRLQRATRALAAGSLEARVGKPFDQRKDEVGTLARDFDAMAEQIQTLITDKEVLLRDVSHELRSPLARIRVALALAQRKADQSAQEDLERIDQETERLDQLVGQILTLARLRSSRLDQDVAVDLNQLVSEVVADARFEQATARIDFEARDVPTVQGNPGELASAIENVLRNALLHSGPQAEIEVHVEPSRSDVLVSVADNGPGVPEEDLKRLFEPFYRVDPSRDHKQSGYGLGLAIAARIIERHGGKVEAANRPDRGLMVTFRLPAARRS